MNLLYLCSATRALFPPDMVDGDRPCFSHHTFALPWSASTGCHDELGAENTDGTAEAQTVSLSAVSLSVSSVFVWFSVLYILPLQYAVGTDGVPNRSKKGIVHFTN